MKNRIYCDFNKKLPHAARVTSCWDPSRCSVSVPTTTFNIQQRKSLLSKTAEWIISTICLDQIFEKVGKVNINVKGGQFSPFSVWDGWRTGEHNSSNTAPVDCLTAFNILHLWTLLVHRQLTFEIFAKCCNQSIFP